MKEYQKLLKLEDNRKNNEKAKKMVKLGLFEEETVETFDFTEYELITYNNKLFKGKYNLYESHTGSLVYIYEKNESDEEATVPTYAYELLKIDDVTKEEYEEILKAGVREGLGILKVCRIITLIGTIVCFISVVVGGIAVAVSITQFVDIFQIGFLFNIAAFAAITCLFGIFEILYRDFIS